ncbi:MAG: hypothetical protein HOO06_04910 [Bdellovibrionaceae bacterium]|jgi:hypothetical protein|nr:hypothetical protein [Pseudobdellovibrionaceae bacterium]
MKLSFLPSFIVIASILLNISCTRNVEKSSTTIIEMPSKASIKQMVQSKPTAPTKLSEIDCYAVFVGAPELNQNYCEGTNVTGTILQNFNYYDFFGSFPSGAIVDIMIPNGSDRKFSIIGFQKEVGQSCQDLKDPVQNYNAMSEPFLIGSSDLILLSGGTVTVDISVTMDPNTTFEMGNCYGPNVPGTGGSGDTTTPSIELTLSDVDPVYPTNGMNWNDYIDNGNSSITAFEQSGVACDATGNGFQTCIHGGELKKVVATGTGDCSSYYAYDNLGAFSWECISTSANTITFFTRSLKSGKFLKDLIDLGGWKSNFVIVANSNSANVLNTAPETWWTNPVVAAPDSSSAPQALTSTSTIYYISTSGNSHGYLFQANNVALVTLPNTALNYVGINSCNITTNSTSGIEDCQIVGLNKNYLWIEVTSGDSSGANDNFAYFFYNIKFSKIIGNFNKNFKAGMLIKNSNSNYIHAFIAQGRSNALRDHGIKMLDSSYNTFHHLQLTNFDHGLWVSTGSASNKIHLVRSYNNGGQGVYLDGAGSDNNTLSRIMAFHNSSTGVFSGSNGNTLAFSTLNANAVFGLSTSGTTSFDVHSVVASGNQSGVKHTGTSSVKMSDMVSTNNTQYGYTSSGTLSLNQNFGYNIVGNNGTSDCFNSGSYTGAPYSDTACTGAGTIVSNKSLLNAYVDIVTTNDVANPDDANGSLAQSSINDWLTFDNDFRIWGSQLANALSHSNSRCQGGTCQIYDYTLKNSDNVIYNNSIDGISANPVITTGACPAALNGSSYTDQQVPSNTFLLRAYEVVGDLNGDDDGLCESNERCIYTPNIGAYQGDHYGGVSKLGCTFQDGTVTGVKLFRFTVNGI